MLMCLWKGKQKGKVHWTRWISWTTPGAIKPYLSSLFTPFPYWFVLLLPWELYLHVFKESSATQDSLNGFPQNVLKELSFELRKKVDEAKQVLLEDQ